LRVTKSNTLILGIKNANNTDVAVEIQITDKIDRLISKPGRCWTSVLKLRQLFNAIPERVEDVALMFDETTGLLTVLVETVRFNYTATSRPPHLAPKKPDAVKRDNVYRVDFTRKK
jgi:hypothetical protein